jgi:GPH family glycoside/pentoside/hexuronide:cation symporter
MFGKIPNVGTPVLIVYALLTYVCFGVIFTVIQVSYGSLAAVMTRNEEERSTLSVCRSIGGGIGGLPAAVLFPMIVFYTITNERNEQIDVLDHTRLLLAIGVIGLLMAIIYSLGYFTTSETYVYPNVKQQINIGTTLKVLMKNKAFIVMSLASMLLIAAQMFISTINIYLFKDFYGQSRLLTWSTIIFFLPMAILIPFINKLIKKYGKKEICAFGVSISAVTSLIMWIGKFSSPWTYILISFFQGFGIGFLTLEVWAMALDVIDYQELLSKKREEASSFALFTLMRKIGQSLAGLVPVVLLVIGYNPELVGIGQSPETLEGLYNVATLVPFVLFVLMVLLMIMYPLSKQKTIEMRETLAIQRQSYEVHD